MSCGLCGFNNKGSSSRSQDEQFARSFQDGVHAYGVQHSMRKCGRCRRPIHKEKYEKVDDKIYHKSCYDDPSVNWRKCPVCLQIIDEDQIFNVPFWNHNICDKHRSDKHKSDKTPHISDNTPLCDICERYQKKEEHYIKLGDDRILCRDCHSTAICKVDALKSLKNYLLHFFKKNKVEFLKDISIHLVDMNDIKKLASLRPPGLKLSDLTISRAIENGTVFGVHTVTKCELKGSEMMVKEKKDIPKLRDPWILIPYGLPRLVAGELLAQEMMHIWMQYEEDYKHFIPSIKEGICKAVAYECLLDTKNDPIGKVHKFVKKLREFHELKFKEQPSRIYGYGFIGARIAIEKLGIKNALEQIYKKTNKGRTEATMIMEEDLELDEYDYY